MSNLPPDRNDAPRRFADSPAPWILAFVCAALAGLLAIAPKHRARQDRLERMAQTRDGIWYDEAATTAPAEPSAAEPPVAESLVAGAPTTPLASGAIGDAIPTDDANKAPERREAPPLAIFISLSLAAVAAGLGLLSYLRSVSRDRPRRSARNDS